MDRVCRFSAMLVCLTVAVLLALGSPAALAGSQPAPVTTFDTSPPPLGPANDNFADAIQITQVPFNTTVDTAFATAEPTDPGSSCASPVDKSVWYAFRPAMSGSFTASAGHDGAFLLAIYTGADLASLTEIACAYEYWNGRRTFHADAGTVYYILIANVTDWGDGSRVSFNLYVTPPPQAYLWFSPGDPSVFDGVQFCGYADDPGGLGIQTLTWDFGDGAAGTDSCMTHQYASDGDYSVTLTVMTPDGRTASTRQTVQVRTHDVAITRLMAPTAARVGQTRSIAVEVKNSRYPERVRLELFKSVPGGFQWVTSTEQNIPVRSGGRTTSVSMSYTFALEDAVMGKATFKASATIVDKRDALPGDNEAISAPSKVSQ